MDRFPSAIRMHHGENLTMGGTKIVQFGTRQEVMTYLRASPVVALLATVEAATRNMVNDVLLLLWAEKRESSRFAVLRFDVHRRHFDFRAMTRV